MNINLDLRGGEESSGRSLVRLHSLLLYFFGRFVITFQYVEAELCAAPIKTLVRIRLSVCLPGLMLTAAAARPPLDRPGTAKESTSLDTPTHRMTKPDSSYHPLRSLVAAARLVDQRGERLNAGDIVPAGAATAAEAMTGKRSVLLTVEKGELDSQFAPDGRKYSDATNRNHAS
jgi:hypothetical protein